MRLALYQPDIPQNAGAILRLAACLNVAVDVIAPCGFVLDDRKLKRSAMDYLEKLDMTRHPSWRDFIDEFAAAGAPNGGRIVLLTTGGDSTYTEFAFAQNDTLLLGQESAGVPKEVHMAADARIRVPLMSGSRSLNLATAAAMVLGEALRQTAGFPAPAPTA